MISVDNFKTMPRSPFAAKVTFQSDPTVRASGSFNAVMLAVTRGFLTASTNTDATLTREILAKNCSVTYVTSFKAFIITGLADIKHTLMGLTVDVHCPDTGCDYKLKIEDYVDSNTGKKRNKTIYKCKASIKPGSPDSADTHENTTIVTHLITDFLREGGMRVTDVRRAGTSFVTLDFYYIDFEPIEGASFNTNTMVAGRGGLLLPSGYRLNITWDKDLTRHMNICGACLYIPCACRSCAGPSASPSLSMSAKLARYE